MVLERLVSRLACCWLEQHSSNFSPVDGPRPKWDRLLKRVYVPTRQGKPVQPDRFFPPLSGSREVPWLLCGQLIGPYYHQPEIDTLTEYRELWAAGLQLSDHFQAMTGRHWRHLPWLWTLEAPPPQFFKSV